MKRFLIKFIPLLLFCIVSIGQMWAGDNCHLGNDMTNVYMLADWNSWQSTEALTKVSGNEFYGVRYVMANTSTTKDYEFKLYISWDSGSNYSWKSSSHNAGAGDGKFTSSTTALKYWCNDPGNVKVQVMAASSGFVKLDYRLWGKYDENNETTSRLYIGQTAVTNLSPSLALSPNSATVQGGSTRTITASCTGGSGSYTYSYAVTCGGSDVTTSVLNASNVAEVTFTAPMAATSKTYRVTVTVTETNTQLTGLGFTSTSSTYTDITVPGITAPTVSLTVDNINVNQIALTGTINNYNGYGSSASDLSEVGFYIGETKYTASYKSGSSFKKTITSLTANTSYSIKAFATNPLATGYSSTTSATTLADATYRVKVRVTHNATAPKVYAWTDADGYGGVGMTNGTYGSQSAISKLATGTTYDWYYCDLNNCYEQFLIYTTGDANKTDDIEATRTSDCFWYNASAGSQSGRKGTMDCPRFEPNVYIEATPGGSMTYEEMSTSPTISKTLTLAAKSTYKFKILYNAEYYGKASTNITRAANSVGSMAVDGDYINLKTDAAGDYTFTYTPGTKTVTVGYQSAYTVNFGAGSGGTASATATSAGGSMTTGDYVAAGDNVSFSYDEDEGYTFTGWFTSADGSTPAPAVSENAITSIAANADVYAQFSENMTSVTLVCDGHGHIENSSSATITSINAGIDTHPSITAVPDAGYYFSGWTVTAGDEFTPSATGEANTTITISANGNIVTEGQTLTATFVELDKIYFRDVFDNEGDVTHWGDVYVYFGITWTNNEAYTNGTNDSWRVHMTKIPETNVWWAYVPRNFTLTAAPTGKQIGFSKDNQNGRAYKFYNTKAATRGDYNRALNMFVPYHVKKSSSNSVDYFDNGYWMKYDTRANNGAGYYLKRYNSRNNYTQEGEFEATNDDATFIQFKLRIDAKNSTLNYMITSAGALNYLASSAVTSDNNSDILVNEDTRTLSDNDVKFQLTTTSEGIYTFILDQSGDKMKLHVIYPVEVGDYKLVHEYNDGTAKSSHSDVIKASEVSGKTVSMFLNMDAETKSLKLYKCTAITNGRPEWGSNTTVGTGTGLFNTTTFNKGKGVYKFDIAISADAISSFSEVGLYSGNYYIKTDCAPGGWANYKQNVLHNNSVNFNRTNPLTFDYYFCKWIGSSGTNVKCVVANDYNNEVTDTLYSDAILTRNNIAYETLPYAANVRFSYNSATNELKRTYLLGSSEGGGSFLYIQTSMDNYVYAADGTTDLHDQAKTSSTRKFTDLGNWTYQLEVRAYPTSKAGVYTDYPTVAPITTQPLVPDTNTLIGGETKGSTMYEMLLVYDFRTNYLMSAWVPTGDITTAIDDVDVLLIRHGQNPGTAITFNGGSLDAKRMIGAVEFRYNDLVGHVGSWNATTRPLLKYFISFPFDVNVNDLFGLNSAYGDAYVIQKYDGDARATKGFFKGDGTTSFWRDLTKADKMNKFEGYCLILDNDYFNDPSNEVWENKGAGSSIYLYFPSTGDIGDIAGEYKEIDVPAHLCKIERTWTDPTSGKTLSHQITDSHWNLMGVPTFNNTLGTTSGTPGAIFLATDDPEQDFKYYYGWNSINNQFSIANAADTTFKAMHCYMVQYTGTVKFTGSTPTANLAARRIPLEENYNIELQVLNTTDEMINRTYIELRDEASDGFALNEDVYMSPNNNAAEVYSFAGDYDVAANVLSINNHVIELGVNVHQAGEYTIAMPSYFSGTATLVDTQTGIRTNLALDNYTVTLAKGVYNDRFLLEINIQNVATAIDGVSGDGSLKDGNAHKFLQNGVMYILQNGVIYDARGLRIQ